MKLDDVCQHLAHLLMTRSPAMAGRPVAASPCQPWHSARWYWPNGAGAWRQPHPESRRRAAMLVAAEMPQKIGASGRSALDPGAPQSGEDHTGDRGRCGKGAIGCRRSKEDMFTGNARTGVLKIQKERVAYVLRERQSRVSRRLCLEHVTHAHSPTRHHIEPHVKNVACPQGKTRQQQENGAIARTPWGLSGSQDAISLSTSSVGR